MGTKLIQGDLRVDKRICLSGGNGITPNIVIDAMSDTGVLLLSAPQAPASKAIVRNVAPGALPEDAANIEQLNEAVTDVSTNLSARLNAATDFVQNNFQKENKLDFFDPSLINISYCNHKHIPGWRVFCGEDAVDYVTNEYFSGGYNVCKTNEVIVTPVNNMIELSIQTASSVAHANRCKITSLSLTKEDGTPVVLNDQVSNTFAQYAEPQAVYRNNFNSTSASAAELGSATWDYGWGLGSVTEAAKYSGDYGLQYYNANGNWSGCSYSFEAVPGNTYTIKFKAKAISNGINFSLKNGESTKIGTWNRSTWFSATEWTDVSVEAVATDTVLTLTFGGPGNKLETKVYIDCLEVFCSPPPTPGYADWTNMRAHHSSEVNQEEEIILVKSNSSTWDQLIDIPLTNLIPEKWYVIRLHADITSGGINVATNSGTFYKGNGYSTCIMSNGDHAVLYKPVNTESVIYFSGTHSGLDVAKITNLHIFSQDEPLGEFIEANPRIIVKDASFFADDHSLCICSNYKKYFSCVQIPAITVEPGTRYKVTFTVQYDLPELETISWQPYITATDEDKVALVTSTCTPVEQLQCGGPWIGSMDGSHMLKIDIDANTIDFLPTEVSFALNFAETIPVLTKITFYDNTGASCASLDKTLSPRKSDIPDTYPMYYLSLADFDLSKDTQLSKISILFIPMPNEFNTSLLAKVVALRLFGSHNRFLNMDTVKGLPFRCTPNNEAVFTKRLYAPLFLGVIDDGFIG